MNKNDIKDTTFRPIQLYVSLYQAITLRGLCIAIVLPSLCSTYWTKFLIQILIVDIYMFVFFHWAAIGGTPMGGRILCLSDPGLFPWPDPNCCLDAEGGRGEASFDFDAELYPFSSISARGLTFSVGRMSTACGWLLWRPDNKKVIW